MPGGFLVAIFTQGRKGSQRRMGNSQDSLEIIFSKVIGLKGFSVKIAFAIVVV
jgi:hypothetical protein